ncbi:MAG: BMP family ABC transporter substrate-binding protein, partial [Lachnospiraceae bacterium]|nr:BMP family ABC transporter substrate-binding protein [Lachnospiraceae bacterium]
MWKKRCKSGALLLVCLMLTACGSAEIEDYATNEGYTVAGGNTATGQESVEGSTKDAESEGKGIPLEEVKIGVVHLTSPDDGNGYTYTHDLGIQGMEKNLGLSKEQVVRKLNVDDTDEAATIKALQECVDEGCNIIFTTSWGYMEPTAEMAEKYPDIYFSHGTGYLSNGKNFNN